MNLPLDAFLGCFAVAALSAMPAASRTALTIAANGRARCAIVVQPGATEPERYAAQELAEYLGKITGATFTVGPDPGGSDSAIIVGPGPGASQAFPEVALDKFGPEQLAMKQKGNRILLAGGRPRGTLYAVYRFLFEQCGVRWWSPWATKIPSKKALRLEGLDRREKPAFESRDPFWFSAFDGDWAAHNLSNSYYARLEDRHGGKFYPGFVHSYYPLVPPEEHFKDHPEWYSLVGGKRLDGGGQLCTTNRQLRDFIVERVKAILRKDPKIDIVSVSQNDCGNPCECPDCKAVDDSAGSHAGTTIALANYVAEKIEPEFPNVFIDTLAYQYSRRAPRGIKPRSNVIVKLCSIECNFAAPLTDASNASFAQDMTAWSKICDRLFVWDYTTNFSHYVQPQPNWFVQGPNIRFFRDHGSKWLFEEGAYNSDGAEMAEMRAWVEAQLMWNPDQDDKKLIQEFLEGYYGKAAKPIRAYMDLVAAATRGDFIGLNAWPDSPPFTFETMAKAERLWDKAAAAVAGNPDLEFRVKIGRLPLKYVWLLQWTTLRRQCLSAKGKWPMPLSRKEVAARFKADCGAPGPKGWSTVTALWEGGTSTAPFLELFKTDPADPVVPVLPRRKKAVAPPSGIGPVVAADCVDAQDDLAVLFREGEYSERRPDPAASDGIAVWMPATHHEWAFSLPIKALPAKAHTGKWKVYAVVRVEKSADAAGTIFTAGIYDQATGTDAAELTVAGADASTSYKAYLIGTVDASSERYVWVAPSEAGGGRAIWVDRVFLVRTK